MRDFLYTKLSAAIKSAKRSRIEATRARGKLTPDDANNRHAAVSYWEGRLSALEEYKAYFEQWRALDKSK